ncbi:MAG: fructosamine kinase family protein [Ketobacter sp.]|nr:fructosamine kinase family protein [Ketobacter sp.]
MLRRPEADAILTWLAAELGCDYRTAEIRPSGAGCINATYEAYKPGLDSVFLKVGSIGQLDMYKKESLGLQWLRRCDAVRVPGVYSCAELEQCSVLALEFIPLASVRSTHEAVFGEALAQLHSIKAQAFGLDHNNYIGRTHQINGWHAEWWSFYVDKRLLPQRKLAEAKSMRRALLEQLDRLMALIPGAMKGYAPDPVLLHGDLWSGNMAVDAQGKPTLFDPAVYFGDAETDLAMTRMFGAPGEAFYDAYHHAIAVREGHVLRRNLYDLYHWLNHFNLFGVIYLGQVESALNAALAELG